MKGVMSLFPGYRKGTPVQLEKDADPRQLLVPHNWDIINGLLYGLLVLDIDVSWCGTERRKGTSIRECGTATIELLLFVCSATASAKLGGNGNLDPVNCFFSPACILP